ncbi:hypothetical protein [Lyngbya sp. PCC 8106]|uniref:hypothetical protein n=1 Tax=Lyngbya sp. (strain PCC 8106) TaxID=313612 RepID=UPI001E2FEDFC|nr:hypothetical protein [Lyngbya sp. PCC 8106]
MKKMSDSDRVPLMFQSQLEGRGKIQYAGDAGPVSQWVEQWLEGCPPIPESADESIPIWKRGRTKSPVKMPEFGKGVETKQYTISWRLVTNCGQDEDIIRPIIGAKGLPFYPGSAMKGAFWRVCPQEKREDYCGGEVKQDGQKTTKPGILRFHGGIPSDMYWAEKQRLIDVVHSQQKRQVMENAVTSANVQISLYQCQLKFGISSNTALNKKEWDDIWQIWEKALGQGIGSRVSAGYGRMVEVESTDRVLLSVNLSGYGLRSQLLNKTPEFRPNMFKAALRGHTLRLLAGVTDANTAQLLTKKLWGGISERRDDIQAIVGQLGVNFTAEELDFGEHRYKPNANKVVIMPTYDLQAGTLDLLWLNNTYPEKVLKRFVTYLIKFSLLLGGFGKSWRRVNHNLFFPEYFNKGDKPAIGCHWEFNNSSNNLYVTAATDDLKNIAKFLAEGRERAIEWLKVNKLKPNCYITDWREVWHPEKVEVWGRIAENNKSSKAIHWFHGSYSGSQSIKQTSLTGKLNKIGCIWHRMYPRYVKTKAGELKQKRQEYVELLTIFPDESASTKTFLEYLHTTNEFIKLSPTKE